MKYDIFAQQMDKFQNLFDTCKINIKGEQFSKFYAPQMNLVKGFKNFYDNNIIIIQQDSRRILSQEHYEHLQRIYQAPQQEKKQNVIINDDQKQNRMSQTDSLSLLEASTEQFNIFDSDVLQQLLQEKGYIFTSIQSIDYIITSYKQSNQFTENFEVLIGQGNYSRIFHGYCFKRQENIAIKIEKYFWNQFIENQFQYQIQFDIYNKYPNIFLRIDLPVFIQTDDNEQLIIISKHELGQINLFNYCLQNKINDSELVLIRKQILNQILLLHKHNVAHRDVKPQNVVFVKEKGWLLCDFEFSILYSSQICVTHIKGTRCFLPPGLRINSCQAGVQLKQNLLQNDLYALGITVLIIKNQIQNSNQVDDFLRIEQDPEILVLLNQQQNKNLFDTIDFGIPFVNPILTQKEIAQSEILDQQQMFSMLQTLYAFGDSDLKLREQLIRIIDINLRPDRQEYFFANFYIYQNLEIYLQYFQNIIQIQVLKSNRYWKQVFKTCTPKQYIGSIQFMQTLGLSDLVLQFGKKILNQNYCIAIHVCIIQQLMLFKQFDQVIEEYQNMIKFKDFVHLSSLDQLFLVEISLQLFQHDLIEQNDFCYLSEQYLDEQLNEKFHNFLESEEQSLILKISKCHNSEQKQAVLVNSFVSFQKDFGEDQLNFKIDFALKLYNIAFNYIDFMGLIQFNIAILDKLKYFCQMTVYQQLLKQSIYLQFLYDYQKQKQRYKQINIVMIYQSESQQQQIVLDLIKQCSILIYQIKKQQKLQQIIFKILKLCQDYEQIIYNGYKSLFINTLNQIIIDQRQNNYLIFQQWFKVLYWIQKNFNQIHTHMGPIELGNMFQMVAFDWIKIRGRKRHDNLVNNFAIRNKKMRQFYEINYVDKMSINFFFQVRQFNSITKIFIREQYLLR